LKENDMSHQHTHEHTTDLTEEKQAAFEALIDRMEALGPEKQHMFIDEITVKVKKMVEVAIAEEDPVKRTMMLGLATNSLNLIGLTNAQITEAHDEWTSTGDRVVGELWNDWMHEMTSLTQATVVPVSKDDLPEEVIQRLAANAATDEDKEIIRAAILKNNPDADPDAEIAFGGWVGEPDEDKQPDKGYGLYL
jgi:hypothetical protein